MLAIANVVFNCTSQAKTLVGNGDLVPGIGIAQTIEFSFLPVSLPQHYSGRLFYVLSEMNQIERLLFLHAIVD